MGVRRQCRRSCGRSARARVSRSLSTMTATVSDLPGRLLAAASYLPGRSAPVPPVGRGRNRWARAGAVIIRSAP